MAQANPAVIVFCVDWFRGNIGVIAGPDAEGQNHLAEFHGNVTDAGLNYRVFELIGDSTHILPMLGDEMFDMIFLDGDHRRSVLSCDIKQAMRLTKTGGVLCGHDYDTHPIHSRDFMEQHAEEDVAAGVHCGVILAVDDLLPMRTLMGDTVWATRKADDGWTGMV